MTTARAAVRRTAGRVVRPSLVERVTASAAADGDLQARLRAIVTQMARDGQRGACIALINERGELYLAAWDGEVDESVQKLRLPVGKGMMGRVAAAGRPVVLHDLDGAGPVAPANRAVGSNALTRSAIAVPIWYDEVVIGVLEMGSRNVGQFGDGDVVLLEGIAGAIAEAVRAAEPNKFAAEVLRHRVRELTFLQDTAALLSTSLEVDAVARAIVRTAADGLVGRDAVLLRIHGTDVTALAAFAPREDAPLPTDPVQLDALPFVMQVAASSGVTAATPRVPAEVRPFLPGADAVAGVPVLIGGDAAGVLLVSATDERGLDPAQVRLLEGVAHLAGLALANAESHAQQRDAAVRDSATGLLNRSEFERLLSATVATPFAVLAIDVDHLRIVNDTTGHEAGDLTLRHVARTLAHAAPPEAVVARTGGDEFALVLQGATLESATAVAEQLRETMHGVAIPHGPARISVGCASADANQVSSWQVWDAAMQALRRAKKWGRDRVEAASPSRPMVAAPRWEALLDDIFDTRGIRAVYQPIVRLDDLELTGYEALARPLGAPADAQVGGLFAAAQAVGMSRDLDWLCRRAAVQDARGVPAGVPIFVNVGVWTLLDPLHDVDQMLLLMRWAKRSPRDIVLEITEREVVSDVPRLREVLASYRAHGFRFALDDVGEGHSTLEILAAARPEFVKLAQSLVAGATDVGPRAAIHAVLAFAQASTATVIAEGIEGDAELALMRAMAVHLGQGFALGMPADLPAPGEVSLSLLA